jgi:ATP phosphoribosyltransferase
VPDFADIIVDHTQTGQTLKENKLKVFDIIVKSTTKLISYTKLNKNKTKIISKIKLKLEKGMKNINYNYKGFINEKEIKNIDYTKYNKKRG